MDIDVIITLSVIGIAIVLFATEALRVDIVAILIMLTLMLTGVITAEQGVAGFSNKATITVAFMFILSAALLKTGALQYTAHKLSDTFRYNFNLGIVLMMVLIAIISAFINNTPVVAIFIPVIIQIAHSSGQSPMKMLIPLSFASIFGGMCTLVGTSTNILVSGIAEEKGLDPIGMFEMTPVGLVLLAIGIMYMLIIGKKLLPNKKRSDDELTETFDVKEYITEIELLENSKAVGCKIMDSDLIRKIDLDIIEIRRNGSKFTLPQGDFILKAGDILKVRSNVKRIKDLKDKVKVDVTSRLKIGDDDLRGKFSTLVEMVVTSNSDINNKTLKSIDFRRKYRAIPLAIKHREDIIHDNLYETPLKSGDIILAEVKTHFIKELKKLENSQEAPFVLLSEDKITDFDKRKFIIVMSAIFGMITLATLGLIHIMVGAILAVMLLVLFRVLSMKEAYEAVNWKIIFLLAGALSLGKALHNTELDLSIASLLIDELGGFGPVAVLSGLYFSTSMLTEIMSNNASAALMAPIAIATAQSLGVDLMPFIITVTIAASASFMTPIGYQTNTMVFSAGQYRFSDFFKAGVLLNLSFWIVSSFLIPWIYGMI
jgi:di/tricarboxylate transporter